MERTRKSTGFLEDTARRGILAHMEHLRSIGEAFSGSANTYFREHNASESGEGWLEEFPKNLSLAARELHRTLFETPRKVHDILGREDEGLSPVTGEAKTTVKGQRAKNYEEG